MTKRTPALALAAALSLALTSVLAGAGTGHAQEPASSACGPAATVRETLPGGTRWQMCWHVDEQTGLVLEDVKLNFRRGPVTTVLDAVTLGQLNVPYDTGTTEWNDITSFGFGGDAMQRLPARECPGGSRRAVYDSGKVLCVVAEPTGPAQRVADDGMLYTRQGVDLVLRTVSKVGWYEYITEYRFGDDGRITARLGATGDLSPTDYTSERYGQAIGPGATDHAAAHHHNAVWRVDPGLGSERIEQFDTVPTGQQGRRSAILATTRTAIPTERALTGANRRWWRVVSDAAPNTDGHLRSYQLVTGANDDYESRPEMKPELTVTQARACEKFASFNLDPECAARSVVDYANGETLTEPVLWVRIGFHHLPRDEDQSPMHVHWQGFDLLPRDLTATNPLAPSARAGINGRP